MPTFESLIREYGYWIVFGGALLEGETVTALSGYAAHRGLLLLPFVLLAAFLGATIGDQFWFQLGRYKGRSIFDSRPQWKAGVERVEGWFERWDVGVLLVFRFIYGMRSLVAVVFGAGTISAWRFTIFNAIGAAIWVVAIAGGGYLLGSAMQAFLGDMKVYEEWGFGVVVLIGLILLVWHRYRSRKKAR